MPLADWRPQQDGEGKESKTGTAERILNGGGGVGRFTSEHRRRQPVGWYGEYSPRRFSNLEALYNRRSVVLCFKSFFFFSLERTEFNKFCNLIGSRSGQNFPIRLASDPLSACGIDIY